MRDDGVVVISTRLRPGRGRNCGSIPGRHKIFSRL